jgi:hypothetical protein
MQHEDTSNRIAQIIKWRIDDPALRHVQFLYPPGVARLYVTLSGTFTSRKYAASVRAHLAHRVGSDCRLSDYC